MLLNFFNLNDFALFSFDLTAKNQAYRQQTDNHNKKTSVNTPVKKILLLAFLIGFCSLSYGQIKVIDLDINSRSVSEDIPFDQYFTFKSFKTDYDIIEFKLTIDKGFKNECNENGNKKYYFCGMNQFDTLHIDPVDKMASFRNLIGPLHPNVPYLFKFKRVKYVKFTNPEEEKKFKNEILSSLKKNLYIDYSTNKKEYNQDKLREEVFDLVKKYSKVNGSVKLLDKNGKEYTSKIVFDNTNLGTTINNLSVEYTSLVQALNGILDKQDFIIEPNKYALYKRISSFTTSNNIKLKRFLNTTSIINTNTNKTLKQLIELLFKDLSKFKGVIKGELKIANGEFKELNQIEGHKTDIPDKNSIAIVKSVFEKIKPQIKELKNKTLTNNIINNLGNINEDVDLLNKKNKEIGSFIEKVPNILEGAFLKDEFQLSHSVTIPVESSKNIYYGLDAGFMYAFDINTVFTYQGLNIYLAPINRETPLAMYKGRDRWLKRLSIYVGIAQTLSSAPNNYDSLFGGNSLLFGAGWRFNRAMRINAGGLIYKEKNANPLISETQVMVRPTISLTVDIDLAAGLGTIGKAFNFIE